MKVGEMAGRAGYAMPSVALVECEEGEECIATRVDDSGGLVLAFHQGFEKRYPPAVADFLIAQELVQTNLGVYRQLRWIRVWRTVFAMVLGLSAALIGAMLLEPLWRAFVVAMGIAYVLMTGVNLVLSAIWSRWATRRADHAAGRSTGQTAGCGGAGVVCGRGSAVGTALSAEGRTTQAQGTAALAARHALSGWVVQPVGGGRYRLGNSGLFLRRC